MTGDGGPAEATPDDEDVTASQEVRDSIAEAYMRGS